LTKIKYVNYPRDPILLSLAKAVEIQPWIIYRHALEMSALEMAGDPHIQELIPVTDRGRRILDDMLRRKHERLSNEKKICGEADPYCSILPRHVCYLAPGHEGNHASKCPRNGLG